MTMSQNNQKMTYCYLAANDLPNQIWGAAVIPHGDSFFLVGGARGDDPDYVWLADIYRYDEENDDWIKLGEELKTGRAGHVALLVPEYIFPQCE